MSKQIPKRITLQIDDYAVEDYIQSLLSGGRVKNLTAALRMLLKAGVEADNNAQLLSELKEQQEAMHNLLKDSLLLQCKNSTILESSFPEHNSNDKAKELYTHISARNL